MRRRKVLMALPAGLLSVAGVFSASKSFSKRNATTRTMPEDERDLEIETPERKPSERSFLEARVVTGQPDDAVVLEYGAPKLDAVPPVREAVREAVDNESGVGNAGIASDDQYQLARAVKYVRYRGDLVKVQVMSLD